MQSEYNVLYENWVRVRKMDGTTAEVSVMDALLLSHEYVALAGETPTQDVSMLRFLEAILFTVFSRVTEEGKCLNFWMQMMWWKKRLVVGKLFGT